MKITEQNARDDDGERKMKAALMVALKASDKWYYCLFS